MEEQDKPSTCARHHCQLTVHNLIYTSNKFEGSKLTKGQTTAILEEFPAASSREGSIQAALADEPRQLKGQDPSPKREVLQHLLAARLLCAEPALPLTEDKIRRTHATLVDGLLDDDGEDIAAGAYRTEPISAKGRLFIEAEHVLLLLL
jgi:Fic family protein